MKAFCTGSLGVDEVQLHPARFAGELRPSVHQTSSTCTPIASAARFPCTAHRSRMALSRTMVALR
jgi:hypothetical protein